MEEWAQSKLSLRLHPDWHIENTVDDRYADLSVARFLQF
jgi:hypothetical protein